MSLPPQILRIKRKRTDEPVDSLYLEAEASPSKRRVTTTGHDFVFKRLVQPTQHDLSPVQSLEIPVVVPTQPGKEQEILQRLRQRQAIGKASTLSIDRSAHRKSAALPRRFHLSRAATLKSTPASSAELGRKRKTNVAVFVEQDGDVTLQNSSSTSIDVEMADEPTAAEAPVVLDPPQKRPSTPAVDTSALKSRVEAREHQQQGLYEALQRYAADEAKAAQLKQVSQLRHLEPGPASGSDLLNEDMMEMTTDDAKEKFQQDEADYIYDTYVRYANTLEALPGKVGENSTAAKGKNPSTLPGSYGYLVIPEAEQTLWETLYADGDESESEHDWDSEEDDENHENWYGADYPEDEVSSDDDREVDPYRYRRGSDDIEDWDSGEEGLSDESSEQKPNWRRAARGRADFSL